MAHTGGHPTRKLRNIDDPLQAIENSIDGDNLTFLKAIRQKALSNALPVYLVGGPLRDIYLGTSIKDLDFVLEGDATQLAAELARELGGQLVVHDRFGTATVSYQDHHIDLVTARGEVYDSAGALPEVSPGTIYDDLARRDFTVNTMALPLYQTSPVPLDPHDGRLDLERGLVRTLHWQSFADDPTRILRAVRYEQRFGFRLEVETEAQLKDAVSQRHMDAVSGDRLRHELERILEEESPVPALQRAIELGVLQAVHPALSDTVALQTLAAGGSTGSSLHSLVYLGGLVYPLSERDVEAVIVRLNRPGEWAEVARDTVALHRLETQLAAEQLSNSELVGLLNGKSEEAMVAVSRICGGNLISQRLDRYLGELSRVRPALDGDAVLAMGAPQGPLVGSILRKLRAARLDHQVESEEDERRMVQRILAGREDA